MCIWFQKFPKLYGCIFSHQNENNQNFIISGGPVIVEESHAFGNFPRFVLLGTVHGAFHDCSNDLPGIFVETDDLSVLEFLYKEAYGSG